MSEQREFGFCPKCGAVTQDGVCLSCGYGKRIRAASQKSPYTQEQPQAYSAAPRKKGMPFGKKLVIGICIVLAVLFIAALCMYLFFSIRLSVSQAKLDMNYGYDSQDPDGYYGYQMPYEDGRSDYYDDYNYYDSSDYYIPDESDEYYETITDATSEDLSYGVLWKGVSVYPDASDDMRTYDCVYPVLTGEGGDKFNLMNEQIRALACEYEDMYQDYDHGVYSYGYVTYMDEEKISIVIRHGLSGRKWTQPVLRAVSFDMETGERIPPEQMIEISEEVIWQFRSMNSYQNGTVEAVDELSDEELRACLEDEENSIMFYTPVGLEIGFNYDGGWVTVTLKDRAV